MKNINFLFKEALFISLFFFLCFILVGIIKFGSASSHSGHHGHGFHFRSNDQEVQEEEPMVGYASPSDAPSSFRPNSRSTHLSSAYRYAAPSDSPATYRSTSYSLAPAYGRTIPCPQHILLGCVPIVRNVPCQAPAYGNSY